MGKKALLFLIASLLFAYYIYCPIPDNVEKPWKLMFVNAVFKTLAHVGVVSEKLGLTHFMNIMMVLTNMEYTAPISDENVTVMDTAFHSVPVRLYIPKKETHSLRSAMIFIHGGGWSLGSAILCTGEVLNTGDSWQVPSPQKDIAKRNGELFILCNNKRYFTAYFIAAMAPYDALSRQTSERLNAVVVSTEYRLAPKYHFPVQFEDVYAVTKYFLQDSILEKYNIDPSRVCIAGDSAGGNLAAAVAQQVLHDPGIKVKFKIQVLIYPALQTIDFTLPSYQDNKNMPILPRSLMVRFWSEYFTTDFSLNEAMETNQHVSVDLNHLYKYVNWSTWLPDRFKKGHVYAIPAHGSSEFAEKYPGFLDPRAAPMLVEDNKLHGLPLTYIITCQYDVLRDDGIMYVSRLREAGVPVTHDHAEDAVHGAMFFSEGPFALPMGQSMLKKYMEWLSQNL